MFLPSVGYCGCCAGGCPGCGRRPPGGPGPHTAPGRRRPRPRGAAGRPAGGDLPPDVLAAVEEGSAAKSTPWSWGGYTESAVVAKSKSGFFLSEKI